MGVINLLHVSMAIALGCLLLRNTDGAHYQADAGLDYWLALERLGLFDAMSAF